MLRSPYVCAELLRRAVAGGARPIPINAQLKARQAIELVGDLGVEIGGQMASGTSAEELKLQ